MGLLRILFGSYVFFSCTLQFHLNLILSFTYPFWCDRFFFLSYLQLEDVLCGLFFFFPVFIYCIFSLYISTPMVVACGLKMRLHLLNTVRVLLWLPSKADQMATLNISKVFMLMLSCWYLLYYIFIDVSRVYLLFLNYYILNFSLQIRHIIK